MAKNTTLPRVMAILVGACAAGGALYILVEDAIAAGHWSTDHIMMVIVMTITIVVGHLIHSAIRDRKALATLGFAALFIAGTLLTIYSSVGRQASSADTAVLAARASNDTRSAKQAELIRVGKRLAYAERKFKTEMFGDKAAGIGKCRRPKRMAEKCPSAYGWKLAVRERKARIAELEREIQALGPPMPVAPKADRMAEVLALISGKDKDEIKRSLMLFEPFSRSLFLELSAIVAFGYGFGRRKVAKAAQPWRATTVAAERPKIHPVIAALQRARGPVSNRQLATMMGVSEGEATKSRAEVAEQVRTRRDGKYLAISLAA